MSEPCIGPPAWAHVQDRQAWVDFWSIGATSIDRVLGEPMEMVAAMDPRRLMGQWLDGVDVESAMGGNWSAWARFLNRSGEQWAARGATLGAWHELMGAFREDAVAAFVRELATAPERLTRALFAMDEAIDWSLRSLSDAYLRASQQALAYQKVVAETRAAEFEASASALRRQTAVLEAAVNGMRDGVWVCDEEGRHLLMNPAAEAMFGSRQPGAMLVGGVDALYAEDGVTPIAPDDLPLARAIRGETTDDVRAVAKEPGREPITVLMHGRPLRDASGQPFGGVSVIRDITAIERLSQHSAELEQENQRVRASSRLRNQFMANMSHELRTPLNAVIGFAELMHDGGVGEVSPQQHAILGDILSSGRHLLDMINDLLDLAKIEAGKMSFKPKPFDLKALVEEICAVIRATGAGHLHVVSAVSEAIGSVTLDPARVRQILYNYLSNAVKFTSDRGHIIVRAEPYGERDFLLEVEDDGVGIDVDDQKRLFTPFQQLDPITSMRFGGTGLGLALTRRIVEAQGGSVGVRSIPGAGSVFYAILPRATDATPSGTLVPPRIEPGA